ncbi:Negative regulator of sigma E activity [Colwellia sp. M166]|jgi:sigma-E factor negative regulatory protein RseA|uniref:sigma-E factor negative regulatory protein n=1 Tax=Colwellia sp. M166 TaxID=2583805 RepID=UPI00211F076E|nr:RseA family anti-sigma factor [Colwellia sp. M166]UUO24584.1 Negative regulator of sigma E activity [Colwellia sp. M166]|tara:strand:- start:82247 stop:82840 length:594 start_codon:yes stop_codon:yes gene_type:complete
MSENKFETVSSVVDNYQANDELFEELLNDSDLSATWGRYHLMGDVMRGENSDVINLDLSSKIATAIADEPTILAPRVTNNFARKLKAKVVQFAKPFGQMAIAASAAGLMVMGVQQSTVDSNDVLPINQVVKPMPFGGIAEPVSLNFEPTSRTSEKQAFVEQQRRFQALLSDHQQQIKLSSVDVNNTVQQDKAEDPAK